MSHSRAFVGLVIALCAAISLGPSQASERDAQREVREVHDAYYACLVKEGSLVALERFYGDDFTYLGVDGKLIDKAGLKARMTRNELGHSSLKDDVRRVSVYGDVALVSGHSVSSVKDKGKALTTGEGYLEVWVKRGGTWKLVAEPITPQPVTIK